MFVLDNFTSLVESLLEVYSSNKFLVVEQHLQQIKNIYTQQDAIEALNDVLNGDATRSVKIYKTPDNDYTIFWDAVEDDKNYIHVGSIIKSPQSSQIFHVLCNENDRTSILHLFRYKIASPTCDTLSNFTVDAIAKKIEKIYNTVTQEGLNPIVLHPHSSENFNDEVADALRGKNIDVDVLTKVNTVDVDPDTLFSPYGGQSQYLNLLFKIYIHCYSTHTLPGSDDIILNRRGNALYWPPLFSKDKVTRDLVAINRACINNNLITYQDGEAIFNVNVPNVVGKTVSLDEDKYNDIVKQLRFRAGDTIKDSSSFDLFNAPNTNITKRDYTIVYDDNISTGFTTKQLLKTVDGSYGSTLIFGIGVQSVNNLNISQNIDIKHSNTSRSNAVSTVQERINNPIYLSTSDYNKALNLLCEQYFDDRQELKDQLTIVLYYMGIRSATQGDDAFTDQQHQQAIETVKDKFAFAHPLSRSGQRIAEEASRILTITDVYSFDNYIERLLRPEKFVVKAKPPVASDTITIDDKNKTTVKQIVEAIAKAQPDCGIREFKIVKMFMNANKFINISDVIEPAYLFQICALYGIRYLQDVATRLRYNVQDEINKLKPYQRVEFVKS